MPIEPGMSVSTFFGCMDPDQYVVAVFDTRDPVLNAPGTDLLWTPTRYAGPGTGTNPLDPDAWTAANLGQVFGVTLDDSVPPNIYVSATVMPGTFPGCSGALFGPQGPGGIYKLDGGTGQIAGFASLVSDPSAGLGQLDHVQFPSGNETIYVSNLSDGLITALSVPAGTITDTFDHGIEGLNAAGLPPIADDPDVTVTATGRRIWGLRINESENRLYYAVWNTTTLTAPLGNEPDPLNDNEIWSVEVDPTTGLFITGSATLEATIPALESFNQMWENPVSDIAFECGTRMVVTQRGAFFNGVNWATNGHHTRALEFTGAHLAWTMSPVDKFNVGSYGNGANTSGGIDFDADGNVVATGDALHFGSSSVPCPFTDSIYGFAIVPSTGGGLACPFTIDSYLIDNDCVNDGSQDKFFPFDVEVCRPVSNNCGTSCRTENATILCGSETNSGDFTLTFDVVNDSGFEVHKLLIPGLVGGIGVSPNIIDMVPPLANGDTATGIQLTLTGGNAGDFVCIPMSLMSKDDAGELFECCGTEVCIEIPPCCLSITGETITLDADGNSVYTFTVTNLAGEAPAVADHLFMDVISPAGVTITDEWQALPSLGDGSSTQLSTVIIGAQPGQEICFQITIHDATLNECCGIVHCITMPGEGPGPGPCIPSLLCKPLGDANADGVLDVLLSWPVPNTDDCCPGDLIILSNGNVVGSANPFAGSVTVDCIDGQYCIACNAADGTLQIQACCDVTCTPLLPPPVEFLRGDSNSDGSFDIADVVQTLNFLFASEAVPCLVALDANDDDFVDIADGIYSLEALFGGGPSPWPPYQTCGTDGTPGDLDCEDFPACISAND